MLVGAAQGPARRAGGCVVLSCAVLPDGRAPRLTLRRRPAAARAPGDHLQLPPTVLSDAAAKAGLACTLFERLQHSLGGDASRMLSVQYRMHAAIMDWSSQELYGGRLEAHESVAGHTLADLPACATAAGEELPPLLLIDTAGCGCDEATEDDGDSRYNRGEAEAALAHVERLLAAGLPPGDVGVITPYAAQV